MTDTTIYNPMLDDDDEEQTIAVNPMLDDDEAPTAPVRRTLPRTPMLRPTSIAREPKFGEKGFGKGKPHPHKGSPRSFVTPVDAPYLAFLNEVQVADATTLSLVNTTKATHVSVGGKTPTVGDTAERVRAEGHEAPHAEPLQSDRSGGRQLPSRCVPA